MRLATELHIRDDQLTLWESFLGYVLATAKERSGLSGELFLARARDTIVIANMEPMIADAVAQQDLLHAPACMRAQEALEVWLELLNGFCPVLEQGSDGEVCLWRLCFFCTTRMCTQETYIS